MRRREDTWGGIVLALATVILFWQLSLHPTDLLVGPQRDGQNDLTSQIVVFRGYLERVRTDGPSALLWNSFSLGGTPWLGNPQTAMLYPPNWLYFFVRSEWIVSWLMVGHHWLAGLGTYLLCRKYGLGWPAAVLAGMAFLGSPYYVANTGEGHYNPVCLVALVPWAFLFVERFRAGQRGGIAGTALVLTLAFFCGHVQELFYLVLLLTAFLVADVVRRLGVRREPANSIGTACTAAAESANREPSGPGAPAPLGRTGAESAQNAHPPCLPSTVARVGAAPAGEPGSLRMVVGWITVGLAVAGLAAIELLPNWMYSCQSVRLAGLTLDDVRPMCIQPLSLVQLADPLAFGGPERYVGPGKYYWESVCCFGLTPLVLSVVCMLLGFRRYPAARFSVLWLAAFVFAFGDQTPWFPFLYRLVPGVSLFRAPARALFFCSFFAAILAGVAWDSLFALTAAAKTRWRFGAGIAAGLAICLAAGVWWWQDSHLSGGATVAVPDNMAWTTVLAKLNLLPVIAWTLGALAIVFATTLSRPWRTCSVALGLVVCLGELTWHAHPVLRTVPRESVRQANPVLTRLLPDLGIERVLASQSLISDREAWRSGTHKLPGYEPVPLARIGLFASAVAPRQDAALALAGFDDLNLSAARKRLLDLAGVRYAVMPDTQPRELPGWKALQAGQMYSEFTLRGAAPKAQSFVIYENASALPRAFVLGRAQACDMTQDVVKRLAELDPRETLLVDRDVLPPGNRQEFQSAKIVGYSAAKVSVAAELAEPGYLVLTDTYYPGWSAIVDGQPAPVVPANILFRAVALKSGSHLVEFRYAPPGAKTGGFVSLMTALFLAVAWRRSRSPGRISCGQ